MTKPTPAAMRAAESIGAAGYHSFEDYDLDDKDNCDIARVIDEQTGLPELIEWSTDALSYLEQDSAMTEMSGLGLSIIDKLKGALAKAKGGTDADLQ